MNAYSIRVAANQFLETVNLCGECLNMVTIAKLERVSYSSSLVNVPSVLEPTPDHLTSTLYRRTNFPITSIHRLKLKIISDHVAHKIRQILLSGQHRSIHRMCWGCLHG
jgi:hypothetical protein